MKVLKYLEENLEEILMVLLLMAMAVIMIIQVIARYVFGYSLSWSEEITRYLFIWSAFISVSLCTRKCISIKVDNFIKIFPRRGEAAFKLLNLTISFLFFAVLIPYSWRYLQTTIESGQTSPACGIPMYWVQSAPFVCFCLCGARIIQRWVINLMIVLNKDVKKPEEGNLAESLVEIAEEDQANIDRSADTDASRNADQAQGKASNADQAQGKASNADQAQGKASNVDQAQGKASNADQAPDKKASNADQSLEEKDQASAKAQNKEEGR